MIRGTARHLVATALVGAMLGSGAAGARADSGTPTAESANRRPAMSSSQFQGVSCILGGALAAAASFTYSDVVALATTGALTAPILMVPILATGFAAGCGVFATMAPGLYWIYEAAGASNQVMGSAPPLRRDKGRSLLRR
jgi:hypothetical protein